MKQLEAEARMQVVRSGEKVERMAFGVVRMHDRASISLWGRVPRNRADLCSKSLMAAI